MLTSEELRRNLEIIKDKKIIVYGTGKNAENLIQSLNEFEFVCVLDQYKMTGKVREIPVLTWDDLESEMADVLIIAAMERFEEEIFRRIMYKCKALKLSIYNLFGEELIQKYAMRDLYGKSCFPSNRRYFDKDEKKLKKLIEQYDAISFDLFDTLVMRRVLEPVDVFDIVEARLRRKKIYVPGFKKKRRTAELAVCGGTLDEIYQVFSEMYHIEIGICDLIKEEEILCEKEVIIPRTTMVSVLEYACQIGKKVSIISDMYLSSGILKEILDGLDISGYRKIYVSCEYGKGKGNGIFEEYLNDIGRENRCLHIGDNYKADVEAAEKYGLDAYEVKSAYSLLQISSLRSIQEHELKKENRKILGEMIAGLLNNPFCLHATDGMVVVKSLELYVKSFLAPIVYLYLYKLKKVVDENNFDAVLLGARDGWIFKKIIDRVDFGFPEGTRFIYFLTSRNLLLSATIKSLGDLEILKPHLGNEMFIKKVCTYFDIEYDENADDGVLLEEHAVEILSKSHNNLKHYMRYFEEMGIKTDSNNLFCDLISSGTVHNGLNKIFENPQKGFYLYRTNSLINRDLEVYTVLGDERISEGQIRQCVNLLEKMITSTESSIKAMDEHGNPVYGTDKRNRQELEFVNRVHDVLISWVQDYDSVEDNAVFNEQLALDLLMLSFSVLYEGDADIFNKLTLVDDVSGVVYKIIGNGN